MENDNEIQISESLLNGNGYAGMLAGYIILGTQQLSKTCQKKTMNTRV